MRDLKIKIICSFFLFVLMIALFISCEKDKNYHLDAEFVSYFGSYKNGSWWIFEDTLNNSTDSVYVTDYFERRESDSKQSNDYYDLVEYKLHCKENVNWTFINQNSETGELSGNLSCFNNQKVNLDTDFFLDFPRIYKEGGIYKVDEDFDLEIVPGYQVNSFSFNDVIKVWNQVVTFYFAKNVGLIQYKIGSDNFILVDYSINF
ncbi:MAG: hypothetical protein R2764_05485 [Bacteroidales bacterium]